MRTRILPLSRTSSRPLAGLLEALADDARREFLDLGFDAPPGLSMFVDARYVGQAYEVRISTDAEGRLDLDADALRRRFDDAHFKRYGFAEPGSAAELVNARVVATVRRNTPPLLDSRSTRGVPNLAAAQGDRSGEGIRFVSRRELGRAERSAGPLVIEEPTATTFVPASWIEFVDDEGNLWIEQESQR